MSIKRDTVEARKAMPIATGVLDYFPDALLVVAEVSRIGNEQHHPGQPLHWDKTKSTDQADALMRHLLDRGTLDTDGVRHSAKVAWRALALLQTELDREAELEANEERVKEAFERFAWSRQPIGLLHTAPSITSETWGDGDGSVFALLGDRFVLAGVEHRGVWPPDTRVAGLLTCCGQSEHPLDCPQYRS